MPGSHISTERVAVAILGGGAMSRKGRLLAEMIMNDYDDDDDD